MAILRGISYVGRLIISASLIMVPELPGVLKRGRGNFSFMSVLYSKALTNQENSVQKESPNKIRNSEESHSFWQGWT